MTSFGREQALSCVMVFALLSVSWVDIRSRRIPNALVFGVLLLGLAHAFVRERKLESLGWSLLGVLAGAALLLWQYSRGLIGAGDVKLLAALGAWGGPRKVLWVFLIGSVLGGILSLVALARLAKAERRQVASNLVGAIQMRGLAVPQPSEMSKARGVPYGVSLSLGAMLVLIAGWSP